MKNVTGVRKEEGRKTNCEGSFKNLSRYYTVVVLVHCPVTVLLFNMLRNCRSFPVGKSEVNYVKDKYSSCYSKGKKKANY